MTTITTTTAQTAHTAPHFAYATMFPSLLYGCSNGDVYLSQVALATPSRPISARSFAHDQPGSSIASDKLAGARQVRNGEPRLGTNNCGTYSRSRGTACALLLWYCTVIFHSANGKKTRRSFREVHTYIPSPAHLMASLRLACSWLIVTTPAGRGYLSQ